MSTTIDLESKQVLNSNNVSGLKQFRKECRYAAFHGKVCIIGVFVLQIIFLVIRLSLAKPVMSDFDSSLCIFSAFISIASTLFVKWLLHDSINAEAQQLLQQLMHDELLYQSFVMIPHQLSSSDMIEMREDYESTARVASTNPITNDRNEQTMNKFFKTIVSHYIAVCFVFVVMLIAITTFLPEIAIPFFFCSHYIALLFCSIVFGFMWKRKSLARQQ